MKINDDKIILMMNAFEKYPGILPLRIFEYAYLSVESLRIPHGDTKYLDNLRELGYFDELYWGLYEERKLDKRLTMDQKEKRLAEWVDKLLNHPEQLSDAERKWVKNNPEYKEIIIMED